MKVVVRQLCSSIQKLFLKLQRLLQKIREIIYDYPKLQGCQKTEALSKEKTSCIGIFASKIPKSLEKKTRGEGGGAEKQKTKRKKEIAMKRVARQYFSNFIQLLPHILQQLGKVTIPFVKFQLLAIQYLFCYLNRVIKKERESGNLQTKLKLPTLPWVGNVFSKIRPIVFSA